MEGQKERQEGRWKEKGRKDAGWKEKGRKEEMGRDIDEGK